jgi:hypothetical protein
MRAAAAALVSESLLCGSAQADGLLINKAPRTKRAPSGRGLQIPFIGWFLDEVRQKQEIVKNLS